MKSLKIRLIIAMVIFLLFLFWGIFFYNWESMFARDVYFGFISAIFADYIILKLITNEKSREADNLIAQKFVKGNIINKNRGLFNNV